MGKGPSSGAGGPVNGTVVRSAEEKSAEYAVFALVPIFCVMGLLGILICNILKKKGYRCSADKEGGDEETATPQKEGERDEMTEIAKKKKKDRKEKVRKKSKGLTVAARVIIETSIYVQVVVTFAHKNAKLAHTHAHDVVKCCRGKAKPSPKGSVFVCSHSPCISVM